MADKCAKMARYHSAEYQASFESTEKFKINFQDGFFNSSLGFLTGMILVIFDLQINPILSAKFPVSSSFDSGEKIPVGQICL